jgi:hypothetical protein
MTATHTSTTDHRQLTRRPAIVSALLDVPLSLHQCGDQGYQLLVVATETPQHGIPLHDQCRTADEMAAELGTLYRLGLATMGAHGTHVGLQERITHHAHRLGVPIE